MRRITQELYSASAYLSLSEIVALLQSSIPANAFYTVGHYWTANTDLI